LKVLNVGGSWDFFVKSWKWNRYVKWHITFPKPLLACSSMSKFNITTSGTFSWPEVIRLLVT
jgi:bacteriorhodopsin